MSGKTPSEVHAWTDHASAQHLITVSMTHLSLTDNPQIEAMMEQARAIALAKAQMLQKQYQAASASATTGTAAPPSMDDIARRKAAIAARMAALTASKAAPSLPVAAAPAPVDARARAAQMGSMVSTDAAGNLIINSIASGKKVQAPSFATVKVSSIYFLADEQYVLMAKLTRNLLLLWH